MSDHRDRPLGLCHAMAGARAGLGVCALVGGAAAFVLAGTGAVPASAQQPTTAAPALVFDGVTVVDVEQGKLVPAQRVVIRGNRVQTVGNERTVSVPKGAQIVDARGKYLIPGLWDMHSHSMFNSVFGDAKLETYIANGITGIRDAGVGPPPPAA